MRRILLVLLLMAGYAAAQNSAFIPTGATSNIAVTGTAQTITFPAASSTIFTAAQLASMSTQMVLTNIGTQTVFFRTDGVTATVSNAMPLIANSQYVISVRPNTVASVIAATTGSTFYVTVGVGQ